jgi:hypothetical protein
VEPARVRVHDFSDTAALAVESIRRRWGAMGKHRLHNVTKLLVTADAGGSNGYRLRADLGDNHDDRTHDSGRRQPGLVFDQRQDQRRRTGRRVAHPARGAR